MEKHIKNKLKKIKFLYYSYRWLKKFFRKIKRFQNCILYGKTTQFDLMEFFKNLGMREGEVWMVHSSLYAMGCVEGGAGTVIHALMQCLGKDGTLVMPSFPSDGLNADYVKHTRWFDVAKTPSRMGTITEVFRTMSGVLRSYHLTDSVCAWGKNAEYLTRDHHLCLKPYEAESPFGKFIRLHGKILLIGVHLDSVTLLHASEDEIKNFPLAVYLPEPVEYDIYTENHQLIRARTMVHNPEMSRRRRCNDLWKYFAKEKIAFENKYRGCVYRVIDASMMHEWLVENFYSNGVTMYHPDGIKN